MTAEAIRFRDFREQRVADDATSRLYDIQNTGRDRLQRHQQFGDHDPLHRKPSPSALIDIEDDPGVVPQNLNIADAGNKRVSNNFEFDQRRLVAHSQPLTSAKRQPSTSARFPTQQFYEQNATYPSVPAVTRAFSRVCVGRAHDCNRVTS